MTDKLKDKYTRLLRDIRLIETPSGHKENINALVDMPERFSKENGYETTRFPFEKAGDFFAYKIEDGKLKCLESLPIKLDFEKPRYKNGNPHIETKRNILEGLR